ncbi:MAG TPA: DNA/RNA helicase domain-containing protein [Patescibacteria group bacterium]|nr:DNA/RNA helicase domain-containing protein [Patescibacteria group bacterium]
MIRRDFYSARISEFLSSSSDEILGKLAANNPFTLEINQRSAWLEEISILKDVLAQKEGFISFEYSIPRMGKRIDVVLIIGPVIFVLEFKVDEKEFSSGAKDQVWDYALDLKNFHEASYDPLIAPVLIATKATSAQAAISETPHHDKLLFPICSSVGLLRNVIERVLSFANNDSRIDFSHWQQGRYSPTPTIIEAAQALYNGHTVDEISRNDATAINLAATSEAISKVIRDSEENHLKSICFVTGVPGAGKTLIGLNTATKHRDQQDRFYSVFLSGNGPLVAVLREALARDQVLNERLSGQSLRLADARRRVKAFIQNVHEFRDECLRDQNRPPIEHVAIFDEAQRAWDLQQTASFMERKKGIRNFGHSEPKFLISCLDRHPDWAVVVCLVGGGQEINRGEAGISEWIESLERYFPDWHIYTLLD